MERLDIALRAYVRKAEASSPRTEVIPGRKRRKKFDKPSQWAIIFDTETTTDASQKLRFGTYQIRKADDLMESGIFYDPETLSKAEQRTLLNFAEKHNLKFLTVSEFIEDVFYRVGYRYRSTIVGFNLPFDISRLAIDHSPARTTSYSKLMQGGFSFKLSENSRYPRVQIKHVSSRNAFIQFTAPKEQRTGKGDRKKGRYQPVWRGCFIDIKTLAAALTSTSHSLESLAKTLEVSQKHGNAEHGVTLTPEYIAYGVQDTQVTWECFCKLQAIYALHGLSDTRAHKIHSEASLGKAYLKEMGIQPWRKLQPDFPPELIGKIISTYYGGRSEVHIRKEIVQVLYCDFLSMYPTVCTLMGLWQFVIAQGMTWEDSTVETRQFLQQADIAVLQRPDTWKSFCTIVQVMPEDDIFPVRAKYNGDSQYTIGSNHLTSHTPLWYTLADCVSAKLLTGRAPKILQAISFASMAMQKDLKSVCIAGDEAYRVDPSSGDFFKQVINRRSAIKKQIRTATEMDRRDLESRQFALKILANATSYGIFMELNVEADDLLQSMLCFGTGDEAFSIYQKKYETEGAFFHPLLATLITGAARLMLAITEHQALTAGLDWAFCDTDSMSLARPASMPETEFLQKAQQVQQWFAPLNPYEEPGSLLKIEGDNYSKSEPGKLKPLYCYAVSSKRYALFNMKDGHPVLRKVSAHGLGYLMSPYKGQSITGDAEAWQEDLWQEIVKAALNDTQSDLSKLKNFHLPAVSRYSATTGPLEKWFRQYNKDKPYCDRVRPFNFLLCFLTKPQFQKSMPVAPYNKDLAKATKHLFDRNTGAKVVKKHLRTYRDALAQYHLHPESKFQNADYPDRGTTKRRHIILQAIHHIGKEANKWEEQYFTGANPEVQVEYGISPLQRADQLEKIKQAALKYGVRELARKAGISYQQLSMIVNDKALPKRATLAKLIEIIRCRY